MTKAEKMAMIDIQEYSKMNKEELLKTAKTFKKAYLARINQFKRKGKVSYAQIAYNNSRANKFLNLDKMSRNQLLLEVARFHSFFSAETSTVRGIDRVNKEQDIRIFGKGKSGMPLRTMTKDEREAYWSLYDQYKSANKSEFELFRSGTVQLYLADAVFGDNPLNQTNLVKFFNNLNKRIRAEHEENVALEGPNVLRARGSNK